LQKKAPAQSTLTTSDDNFIMSMDEDEYQSLVENNENSDFYSCDPMEIEIVENVSFLSLMLFLRINLK
jgi:hypothetical protein